ncbi:DUF1554 domain-containing protein [Leptospira gomenensis]|uniref:DUF1554 domain-containing protein n=1 Tax=Leptospira gomenensis TaxID=2484974 RepID=A0A5F1Y9S4_9LEPT|nr:DUF1554 domain-containing protein [Leptospira gomenensis]TGK32703.1 DUF1554 domain-containing protein [Leptospira gomenensis]TGK36850.1 DUF1554 domain-containing protein [Leptospira gomenensis]TGK39926.1 DUF1554 domain-containing protein [Leptospira gomenensis]TGK58061.1 DUF1554 domain-containing protein [Leptospira gomenensis]
MTPILKSFLLGEAHGFRPRILSIFCSLFCASYLFSCTAWPGLTALAKEDSKASNSALSLAPLLLAAGEGNPGNPSGPGDPSTPTVVPCFSSASGCAVFMQAVPNGNLGGVSGADSTCQTAAIGLNAPGVATGSEYKALLMDEVVSRSLTIDWVLYPNTRYYSLNNFNLQLGVTNASAELPANYDNAPDPGLIAMYTGITILPNWAPTAGGTCTSWTTGAPNPNFAMVGVSHVAAGYIDNGGFYACNQAINIYCVQR